MHECRPDVDIAGRLEVDACSVVMAVVVMVFVGVEGVVVVVGSSTVDVFVVVAVVVVGMISGVKRLVVVVNAGGVDVVVRMVEWL